MRTTSATIEMSGAIWINQSGRTFWAVSDGCCRGFEPPLMLWADSSVKSAVERERLTLSKRIENARISFSKGVLALWLPSRELKTGRTSPPSSDLISENYHQRKGKRRSRNSCTRHHSGTASAVAALSPAENMEERERILEELETIEEAALSIVDQIATLKIITQNIEVLLNEKDLCILEKK